MVLLKQRGPGADLFKNRRGSSLPMVLLTFLVILILAAAIGNSVTQWFKLVRNEETNEYAFIAAESAIERCMYDISTIVTASTYTNGIEWVSNDDFAHRVINEMNRAGNPLPRSYSIDVYGPAALPAAEVTLQFSLGSGTVERAANPERLRIPIGITAVSKLENGLFRAYGKQVYAQGTFEVAIPNKFRLHGAVYTIGDMLASDNAQVEITGCDDAGNPGRGDVNVFGTGLEEKKRPEQYYNGGIYARNNSRLEIQGNAYTRSLIRTGSCSDSGAAAGDDNSSITVHRDAIAQGIQVFGKRDAIIVGRNAYTFDDLEMDGEDSVIGVNGSYFGLSYGVGGDYHDASSAVVNAAPVYGGYTEDSMRSRIVINGDVLVNGTTFRMSDPAAGTADHNIEDVSLAWMGGEPYYRSLPSGLSPAEYFALLKGDRAAASGFLNIFQKWPSPVGSLSDWLSQINTVRGGSNPMANDYASAGLPTTPNTAISGFCHNAMAVNDRIYFMDKSSISTSEITRIANLGTYQIDNVEGIGSSYWSTLASCSDDSWPSLYCGDASDPGTVAGRLEYLRARLMAMTHVFARKDMDRNITRASFTLFKPAPIAIPTMAVNHKAAAVVTPSTFFSGLIHIRPLPIKPKATMIWADKRPGSAYQLMDRGI
jgi:hypothetical protein